MPSIISTALCTLGALVLWGGIGFGLARRVTPTIPVGLAAPIAPVLGWACHSVVALVFYMYAGMSFAAVLGGFLSVLAVAILAGIYVPALKGDDTPARMPLAAYALALLLAAIPAIALVPKFSGDAVALAPAMFDHSKIALIDEMARAGVPPVNPVFAEAGRQLPLAYYYLWHFSAAQLAVLFHASGWEADIALTAFTAFASLTLLAGLAVWISGRALAGLLAMPLAFAGSLYHVLEHTLGQDILYAVVMPPSGLGGWLFQSTWAPQHVAGASCLLLSTFLLARLARAPAILPALMLALTVAAGYQTSLWVGGVVGGIALPVIAVVVLLRSPAPVRIRTLVMLAIAAVFAVVCSFHLLLAQSAVAQTRAMTHPIAIAAHPVLNVWVAAPLRHVLDVPAFWLIFLVLEFPAIYLPGLVSLIGTLRAPISAAAKDTGIACALLAAVSLGVASLLTITFVENNDLGWRSVLPAVLVLAVFAAAGLARWLAQPAPLGVGVTLALLALGLIKSADLSLENFRGWQLRQGAAFAQTPALWDAVRRHTGPTERIANNPAFMDEVTAWPANISWALFANRRSCYAGRELALPFAPLPLDRLEAIDAQFQRVFAGKPQANDLSDLATRYQCKAIVLTPEDGAWSRDPFATSGLYTLVEERPERWRIYRAR